MGFYGVLTKTYDSVSIYEQEVSNFFNLCDSLDIVQEVGILLEKESLFQRIKAGFIKALQAIKKFFSTIWEKAKKFFTGIKAKMLSKKGEAVEKKLDESESTEESAILESYDRSKRYDFLEFTNASKIQIISFSKESGDPDKLMNEAIRSFDGESIESLIAILNIYKEAKDHLPNLDSMSDKEISEDIAFKPTVKYNNGSGKDVCKAAKFGERAVEGILNLSRYENKFNDMADKCEKQLSSNISKDTSEEEQRERIILEVKLHCFDLVAKSTAITIKLFQRVFISINTALNQVIKDNNIALSV